LRNLRLSNYQLPAAITAYTIKYRHLTNHFFGGAAMSENPLKPLETIDPKLTKLMEDSRQLAMGEGAMPVKYKFLIALALDAAHGASDGVAALARAAIHFGATKDEIAEAIRVTYYIAGVGSAYTAAAGLKGIV
jgi:alkylhydroperoxidase/carboxymuconolactone decarboxylase family protein YurZ